MSEAQQVEFVRNLKTAMQNNEGEFSEARTWFQKTGLTPQRAAEECLEKIVNIVYQYISQGILQLTVEEIAKRKECVDAKQQKKRRALVAELTAPLPSFTPYLEFVITTGAIEIAKVHYEFEVEPEIELKKAKIELDGDKIKKINFGSGVAKLTLYFLKGDLKIKLHELEEKLKLPRSIQL